MNGAITERLVNHDIILLLQPHKYESSVIHGYKMHDLPEGVLTFDDDYKVETQIIWTLLLNGKLIGHKILIVTDYWMVREKAGMLKVAGHRVTTLNTCNVHVDCKIVYEPTLLPTKLTLAEIFAQLEGTEMVVQGTQNQVHDNFPIRQETDLTKFVMHLVSHGLDPLSAKYLINPNVDSLAMAVSRLKVLRLEDIDVQESLDHNALRAQNDQNCRIMYAILTAFKGDSLLFYLHESKEYKGQGRDAETLIAMGRNVILKNRPHPKQSLFNRAKKIYFAEPQPYSESLIPVYRAFIFQLYRIRISGNEIKFTHIWSEKQLSTPVRDAEVYNHYGEYCVVLHEGDRDVLFQFIADDDTMLVTTSCGLLVSG